MPLFFLFFRLFLQGRNNLGAVYVVPDGSDGITGSGLANSLYTIAVNSVGVGGALPSNPKASACVITSGLSDGNKLHTKFMVSIASNLFYKIYIVLFSYHTYVQKCFAFHSFSNRVFKPTLMHRHSTKFYKNHLYMYYATKPK